METKVEESASEQEDLKILKSIFGYTSFRDNQQDIVRTIVSGRDVFTSMPTGGGKSLCYQIPSLMFSGLTVVISPLIALMKDQVDEAVSKGIAAAYLNSSLEPDELSAIYSQLYKREIKLLYISPERLAVEGYLERLGEFDVNFFAIDEAHCLSQWGHDFRPDYLILSRIRETYPNVPIGAFTATATQQVQDDIISILHLNDPFIVRASFDRKEIFYKAERKTDVLKQITDYVQAHGDEAGIVYRISRKDVEKTAETLRGKGVKAIHYHAGLSKEERIHNQEMFNNDEVKVIVATTAFGMGINKSNIRYVLHGDLPKSMEGYYQETGRAGRDGLDSHCMLFFGTGDVMKQQYFIDQMTSFKEQEKAKENLNCIVQFATIHMCRRKQILEYFGEYHPGNCQSCDVCNDETVKIDSSVDAQKTLSAIVRTNERFGINHIIDVIWGANTEKIRSKNHHTLKTFGVGKSKSKQWWRAVINELIGQQVIYADSERFNALRMTSVAKKILVGEVPFFVAQASADASTDATSGTKTKAVMSAAVDRSLLQKLKEVRKQIAHDNKIPPYIIFSDKTLIEMASVQPVTDTQFLAISGVGEKKLEVYGEVFITAIKEYVDGDEDTTL